MRPTPGVECRVLRHPRVDLVAGQLSALAGLGALGHLDLDVVGVREVEARDAEPARGDLLDRRAALGVEEAVDVLAALTGVGATAEVVHRDRERLVCLLRDRAVAHGAGVEALDDLADRLDLLDRHGQAPRHPGRAEAHQSAQRHQTRRLVVDAVGVLLEDVVTALARRVLEAEDRLGVEEVRLALAPPLVLAPDLEGAVRLVDAVRRVGARVALGRLAGDDVEADATELAHRAGEVALDERLRQTDGLEDLGAAVGRDGRDAHLGHDLEDTLAERLDEVGDGLLGRHALDLAGPDEVLDGLHGEVGVDGGRTETDEQRHVVDLAHVTGLDEQAHLGAGLLADEVVVDGSREEQRRDRREVATGVTVGEHDEARTAGDGLRHLGEDLLEAVAHGGRSPGDVVEAADDVRRVAGQVTVGVDVHDLGELVVVDDREVEDELAGVRRRGRQGVALGAHAGAQGGDELLADRVERRVGHLGEELREVVEEQPRPRRQDGDGRVGAHRAERLATGTGHRGQQDAQLLGGVAERLLAPGDRGRGVHDVLTLREVLEADETGMQPLGIRLGGSELGLDLLVADDAAVLGVDEEHLAGLEASALDDGLGVELEHAGLGGQHDEAVVGHGVATRPQAVAVEDRPDERAVAEADVGGTVPRLHEHRVELVERLARRVHRGVVLPRLGDHHQDRVRQRAAAEVEQLEHLVEARRVGRLGRADREDPLEVTRDDVGRQQALAGAHPVAVALDGVDLTVVRDEAVRVRERPRRERVGREARVHEGELAGEVRVGQVREERLELAGRQHALVDDGARAERGEVDADLVLRTLAQAEREPVEPQGHLAADRAADEQLLEERHALAGHGADEVALDGHLTPAEDLEVLGDRELLDAGLGRGPLDGVLRQEGDARGIRPVVRQGEGDRRAEERVGDLGQDARAVADERVGPGRAHGGRGCAAP